MAGGEEGEGLAAMCNFVVGRACVLCHGQPVGEDAEESLVGKGGGGSRRKRNEVEEGGEREKKLNPRDFIGALYRCHGQFLSSYLLVEREESHG